MPLRPALILTLLCLPQSAPASPLSEQPERQARRVCQLVYSEWHAGDSPYRMVCTERRAPGTPLRPIGR